MGADRVDQVRRGQVVSTTAKLRVVIERHERVVDLIAVDDELSVAPIFTGKAQYVSMKSARALGESLISSGLREDIRVHWSATVHCVNSALGQNTGSGLQVDKLPPPVCLLITQAQAQAQAIFFAFGEIPLDEVAEVEINRVSIDAADGYAEVADRWTGEHYKFKGLVTVHHLPSH
nr:hypothetical protein [Desulfobulbus alkaliphilus]